MGVQLSEIMQGKQASIEDFYGKVIAIDSFNHLYQFLATIRQADGTPLMDSKGNITSHLSGLFSRTANLLEKGVKPIYVFDGTPPVLKKKERERRAMLKKEAESKYKVATEEKDIKAMRKFAQRSSRLTPEMVEEAKKLISFFGLPVVEAPSEGEAQAAELVKKGYAYASSSQDFDSLLFGSPRLLRNLSIAGRRKKAGKLAFEVVKPELIELQPALRNLGLSQEQLIVLGILVGTDFNIGGVRGIGPKNAAKLLQKHGDDFNSIFREAKWADHFDFGWEEVFEIFAKMEVKSKFSFSWKAPNQEKLAELLVEQHDFSSERVSSIIQRLSNAREAGLQKGLGEFI